MLRQESRLGFHASSAQLVMALPMRDSFVYLHAGCYMIWNEERTAAKVTPAA